MAKTVEQQAYEGAKKKNDPDGEGWTNARPAQSGGYFRASEGASCQGVIKGRFPKPGGRKGFIYQICLTKPAMVQVRVDDGEYDEQEVDEGTLISVDEKTALEGLRELVEDTENQWEVFIRAEELRTLTSGNRFWDFTVRKRMVDVPF